MPVYTGPIEGHGETRTCGDWSVRGVWALCGVTGHLVAGRPGA